MKTLAANFLSLNSSNPPTNGEFVDPVVTFLNAITSDVAVGYAVTAVCTVLFITCALPLILATIFLIINYGFALVIHRIYCLKYRLKHGKAGIDEDAARQAIGTWWYWVSRIWFGFELIGLEAIPPDEPVLFIIVHGVMPCSIGSGCAMVAKYRQHHPYGVIDKQHAANPLLKSFFTLLNLGAWTREECVKILEEGNDLAIMPGGNLEAKYSDPNYNIVWGNRKGFAKVAIDAKVTIVPVCCLNLNEAFWTPPIIRKFARSKYAPKRFAFGCGGLPVKLTALVGTPIRYDESKTADDMFDEVTINPPTAIRARLTLWDIRTLSTIKQLLAANQRIPGNQFCALLDRFRTIKPKINFTNTKNSIVTIQV